jgi:hypothetical protein
MKKHFVVFISLLATLSLAQQPAGCDLIDSNVASTAANRMRALLKEKQFAALEDELNDKFKRYLASEYSDLIMYRDLRFALRNDASLEPLLAQWIATMPNSYMARLSKGIFHSQLAYAKRGSAFSNQTSTEQLDAMQAEFEKASADLLTAKRIRPQATLHNSPLMDIARATVSVGAVTDLLIESERTERLNLAPRQSAVFSLAPRWGGSFEALDDLVARAISVKMPVESIRYLKYSVEMEKASHFNEVTKEKTKAIFYWKNAAELCPENETAWSNIARNAFDIEDWKSVKDTASRAIQRNSSATGSLYRRGYANEKMGLMTDAIADYQRAADLGEATSQGRLGYFYMLGQNVPKDLQRAKSLLEASASKGNAHAKQSLEWLNRQPTKP